MPMLSKAEVISAIGQGKPIQGTLDDGSLYIRVDEYVPYVCSAIHAGHQLRESLHKQCLLSQEQRLLEEDPYTDQLISSFPVILIANDSRYEYDLNRPPETCIYEDAWGEQVWQQALNDDDKALSLAKHTNYYDILHALLSKLEQKFGGTMLLDLHSYNWQVRSYNHAPTFNIGTSQVDVKRWDSVIKRIEAPLRKLNIPHIDTDVERDAVFQGRGYQATFIKQHFHNVLIIPLEIKKVFMDEKTGESYPLVLEKLQQGLHNAVLSAATTFNNKLQRSSLTKIDLLPANLEPVVLKVDRALYKIAKYIETLQYVNPINIQQEKRQFLRKRGYEPKFRYRQLKIDPYEVKERLYKLPASQIQDPMIRRLYRSVIDAYATKIEMLAHIGTPQFLYNSLRYYGKPSQRDIDNAMFLLHASPFQLEESAPTRYNAEQAMPFFKQGAEALGLDCKIILSSRLVAKAMVDNSRKALLINKNAMMTEFEINALIHHELGVHMVTTVNALAQPLHIFSLGLPGNTFTQEGLAIFSEYRFGCINLKRLQQLSLRVLAVEMMTKGMSFHHVFHHLYDDYKLTIDEAYGITVRVFRGGGFTKDYLYLSGFRDIVATNKARNISNLYIGKTGLKFIDTIDSLVERDILTKPFNTPVFPDMATIENPVLDYLVASIK